MYFTPLNRVQLLPLLPTNGIIAEIGVLSGSFARQIISFNIPATLHLIDPWGGPDDEYVKTYHTKGDMNLRYEEVLSMFASQIEMNRVYIHRDYSVPTAATFIDEYFDWVYIDAMHTYEGVRQDLLAFDSKVKKDGFIVGHDFSNSEMSRAKKFGVIKAVMEFIQNRGYALACVTIESAPSYVISKNPGSDQARDFVQKLITADPRVLEIGENMVPFFEQVTHKMSNQRQVSIARILAGGISY